MQGSSTNASGFPDDERGRTTLLHDASLRGDEEVVRRLLATGADVNARGSSASTVLHKAILSGNETLIELLLDAGADANAKDSYEHETPLHTASKKDNATIVKKLLDAGASISAQDKHTNTPLLIASTSESVQVARILIDAGTEVDAQNKNGYTSLHSASRFGNMQIVELLLGAGADVNTMDNRGATALQLASREGRREIVQMLLDANADVNAKDTESRTALQLASFEGFRDVVKMLLDAGANVNIKNSGGTTVLQLASSRGHQDVVGILLDAGADLDTKNSSGTTALQLASSRGHQDVVKMLLNAGADINAKDSASKTALQSASSSGHRDVVKMLLDAGADLDTKNNNGTSALQLASSGGHQDVVKMLLNAGADINAKDSAGTTALQSASSGGHQDVVKMLLNAGADLDTKKSNGTSALQSASSGGHQDVVKMLLSAGADINAKDSAGTTALQSASSGGHQDVVKMLLNAGADVNIYDNWNTTALQSASSGGHQDVVKMLLDARADVNTKNSWGITALQSAYSVGHRDVARMRLDARADVNIYDNWNTTTSQSALSEGHRKIVKMLLDAGANDNTHGTIASHSASSKEHKEVVSTRQDAGAHIYPSEASEISRGQQLSSPDHPSKVTTEAGLSDRPGILFDTSQVDLKSLCRKHSRSDKPFEFSMRWELESCLKFDFDNDAKLGDILTITGDSTRAYATTCGEYIHQQWKTRGVLVLNAVQTMIRPGNPPFMVRNVDFQGLAISRNISFDDSSSATLKFGTDEDKDEIIATLTSGIEVEITDSNEDEIVATIETLAWLAATFRPSIAKHICLSSVLIHESSSWMHISLNELLRVDGNISQSCWHSPFTGSIIATGFPIASGEIGLELPFQVMLDFTRVLYCTNLSPLIDNSDESGVFYTGVHRILYPVDRGRSGKVVRWHYETSDHTMVPPPNRWLRDLHPRELENATIILGYSPRAFVHLGTSDRSKDYTKMMRSSAERERDSARLVFDGITFSATYSIMGLNVGANAPFKYTRRRAGQVLVDPQDRTYDDIVRISARQPIILFDTAPEQETGWLVPQISVILDLVHCKAQREKHWTRTGQGDELHAWLSSNSGFAASSTLNDASRANTSLYTSIETGKPFTVKDLVRKIYIAMTIREQCNHLEEASSSGTSKLLLGWDLLDLIEPRDVTYRLRKKLPGGLFKGAQPSWFSLVTDVPVFFCDNLGDIITSAVPLCSEFTRETFTLMASIPALRLIGSNPPQCTNLHLNSISCPLVWEATSFSECKHRHESSCKQKFPRRIQTFIRETRHDCLESSRLKAQLGSAVIFG